MFIKIKLDRKSNSEELKSKVPFYVELDGECSIYELKLKIAECVDVPLEKQVIKTVTSTLKDNEKLMDINELVWRNGSAIMLYSNDNDGRDLGFICFLQFYSKEQSIAQQDYERKSRTSDYANNLLSPCSTITLIGDSESEHKSSSSSESSRSSSESESVSETDCSKTDSEKSFAERKRKTIVEEEGKKKKLKPIPIHSKIPTKISTYLEEFPDYSKKSEEKDTSIKTNLSHSSEQKDVELDCKNVVLSKTKDHQTECTSNNDNFQHRHKSYSPEHRTNIVIFRYIDETKHINKNECSELLASFFDIIKNSDNTAELKFDENSGLILNEGKIWIACQDTKTQLWTLDKTNSLFNLYKSATYVDHFKLRRCKVVIPNVCKSKSLLEIFSLIELQNVSISTAQWAVLERRDIAGETDEFYKKCVTYLCSNEILYLAIDSKSTTILQDRNYQLKFCFWHIKFEID